MSPTQAPASSSTAFKANSHNSTHQHHDNSNCSQQQHHYQNGKGSGNFHRQNNNNSSHHYHHQQPLVRKHALNPLGVVSNGGHQSNGNGSHHHFNGNNQYPHLNHHNRRPVLSSSNSHFSNGDHQLHHNGSNGYHSNGQQHSRHNGFNNGTSSGHHHTSNHCSTNGYSNGHPQWKQQSGTAGNSSISGRAVTGKGGSPSTKNGLPSSSSYSSSYSSWSSSSSTSSTSSNCSNGPAPSPTAPPMTLDGRGMKSKLDRSMSEPTSSVILADDKLSTTETCNGRSNILTSSISCNPSTTGTIVVTKVSTGTSTSSNNGNSSRYKTELCRPFEESGTCKYGDKCQFAHGEHELRSLQRHPKYKTELCRTFHTTGFCPYGPRCHFIHNSEENKKTVISSLQATTNVASGVNGVGITGFPVSGAVQVPQQQVTSTMVSGGSLSSSPTSSSVSSSVSSSSSSNGLTCINHQQLLSSMMSSQQHSVLSFTPSSPPAMSVENGAVNGVSGSLMSSDVGITGLSLVDSSSTHQANLSSAPFSLHMLLLEALNLCETTD